MYQVTYIRAGKLHVVSTPNIATAFDLAGTVPGARLWHYAQKQQPILIC